MAKVEPGTIVGGKYRLEEPIGQGGMASVWRAMHTTLESPVAVKFLETYGSGRSQMASRFLREAKIAASLKHRNVLHILDFGVMGDEDDGQPYMVMELLHGKSLGEQLEGDDPPTESELIDVVGQLLGGLAAVHDAGIVHRDVKPDNVFLVRDADGIYPKLLDFGISKSSQSTRMTETGAVVGTPVYMSPEQARGMKDLDRRTDLWSVGMLLYEAFTGRIPFESEYMGDVLIRVATEDVPPLGEARPELPAALSHAVMKALTRDRDARWGDARAMREALLAAARDLAPGRVVGPRAARPEHDGLGTAKTALAPSVETEAALAGAPRWLPYAFVGALLMVVGVGAAVVATVVARSDAEDPPTPVTAAEPAEPEPVAAEPVAADPRAAEPLGPEPLAAEPSELAPTVAEPAEPPPPEVAEPEPAVARSVPRRPAARRRPTREPVVRPLAPAEPARQPTPAARGRGSSTTGGARGGFLRDLDY